MELDDIEYLRLIQNITDPTVSDEDVLKISRNTVKEVVAELAIKPKLKELEQAIKSALVDEPEKTRDDAAYVLLCSFIANNPTFSAYLSLPKELEEKGFSGILDCRIYRSPRSGCAENANNR